MVLLELVRHALDVEHELILLESVRPQIVDEWKIRVRRARRICRCAHVPGKTFPAVDLDSALPPRIAIWPGIDRFHQRPRRNVIRVANDRCSTNLPISGWERRRIERRWRDAPLLRRCIRPRRFIRRRAQIVRECIEQSLSKPVGILRGGRGRDYNPSRNSNCF